MKKIWLIILCCLPVLAANAQNNQQESSVSSKSKPLNKKEMVYKVIEHMPEFPGGEAALYQYI